MSDAVAANLRFLGWPLGWAFTTVAVSATGGTSGWTQSPPWSAAIGIALGAAGMFAGAWWSRGRREAAAYAAAFIVAAGILKLGLLGAGMLSFFLAGGIVALIGESARRPFDPQRIVRWGAAFAIGAFLLILPGSYLSHFAGALAERITGLQAADTAGNLLGAALAGGLCGAVAAFIGDPDDQFDPPPATGVGFQVNDR
jgi:hypothetical protein